jgi:Glycosyltransferase family 10 (fucosyltransferase) C-term
MSILRVGLIAPKNTTAEKLWLLGYLRGVRTDLYAAGDRFDLVWFLNATKEIARIKRNTDSKVFVVGMEPRVMWPDNYDHSLLDLADRYMGYRNFARRRDVGFFEQYRFPVRPRECIEHEFPVSMQCERDTDFCIFATHDPNIRREASSVASRHRVFLGGPLFGNRVADKLSFQRKCRFEIISENDINDYYFSEKIGEALLAGCVPVYYGCSRIKDHIPADMFVDMHDFVGPSGQPNLTAVIEHCMASGVYERHLAAIAARAEQLLLEQFTIETCLIEPVQHYIEELKTTGFSSRTESWSWKCQRLQHRLKKLF